MTTTDAHATVGRRVWLHDPAAPAATIVAPCACAAIRHGTRLLLVRRCDSGGWELPGGRVDVGETAIEAVVREVREEAGVDVRVTGLVGLFTDPGLVVCSAAGEVRQPFGVVFRARIVRGIPHADLNETSEASWIPVADLTELPLEPAIRLSIGYVLDTRNDPHLA
jgi:8-oxo-dGTP pyrophosphatase MutT (NUDIX family)